MDRRARRTSPDRPTSLDVSDLDLLAHWMDTVFRIPGLNVRVGLDPLIGLIPGVGDTISSFISLYLLTAASRHGVPRIMLLRMAVNILLDVTIGALPLVGDLFDVYWKSNTRNMGLLRRYLNATPVEQRRRRTGDWMFVGGIALLVLATLLGSLVLIGWVIAAIVA